MRIDYDDLKQLASEIGCRVTDLVALSPGNDPFYVNVPSRREAAEWFANLWVSLGFKIGSHPRRLHYIVISQDPPVLKPNGSPYQNTDNDWKFLLTSSLAARYLRLIPDGALADHRNEAPILNADEPGSGMPSVGVYGSHGAGLSYDLTRTEVRAPFAAVDGFSAGQDYLVEVWIEKSTQNDILLPLSTRLGFNLVAGTGETSEILARQAVERAIEDGRPMRILYVSDFDPGGRSMPVALSRKIEFWLRQTDLDLDLTIEPIVLTPEQCEQYRLPRTPLKETERRAAKFEARFGAGATEIDALEALYPGELGRIIQAEACRYIDTTLAARIREAEWAYRREVYQAQHAVLAEYDISDIQRRHAEIMDRFEAEIAQLEGETEELWPEIAEDLRGAVSQVEVPELPKPRPATPPDAPLFDSSRDYLDQIDHYRRWQGRGGAS